MHYDLLIKNGRVLDAESGFDSTADVAITSGVIDRVEASIDPNTADDTIDASGKWVIPGMIDTHAHVVASDVEPWEQGLHPVSTHAQGRSR